MTRPILLLILLLALCAGLMARYCHNQRHHKLVEPKNLSHYVAQSYQ